MGKQKSRVGLLLRVTRPRTLAYSGQYRCYRLTRTPLMLCVFSLCAVVEESVARRLRLNCDGTRAETRFRLSRETDESI